MQQLKHRRLLVASIVAAGFLFLSGCSSAVCKKGAEPLTANWVEKKLPTGGTGETGRISRFVFSVVL